jgi:hypothetical protein
MWVSLGMARQRLIIVDLIIGLCGLTPSALDV